VAAGGAVGAVGAGAADEAYEAYEAYEADGGRRTGRHEWRFWKVGTAWHTRDAGHGRLPARAGRRGRWPRGTPQPTAPGPAENNPVP